MSERNEPWPSKRTESVEERFLRRDQSGDAGLDLARPSKKRGARCAGEHLELLVDELAL